MHRGLLAGLLCSVMPALASAQVRPDATLLPLGRDSLPIYLIRGTDTVPTGTVIDELRQITHGGVDALERVYRTNDRFLGRRLDTLVDTRLLLRPRLHRSRSDRGLETVTFDDSSGTGFTRAMRGDSSALQAAFDTLVINASSVDLFLRAAPLAEGLAFSVRAFSPTLRRIVTVSARVAGVDSVAREPSWRIVTDYAGTPVTFWVGQVSRKLNRQVMQLQPGVFLLIERGGVPVRRAGQRII